MDRSKIYSMWLATTYRNQDGHDTPLCNNRTIQKFNDVNEFNIRCYADYQDFYLKTHDVASMPSIRAKILQFLLSDGVKCIQLKDITADIVDKFFEDRKQTTVKKLLKPS